MFITFEGGEGSGKSTVIKEISKKLEEKNIKFIVTREPGGKDIDISEKIRKIILDKNNTEMSAKTEALLFAASRVQHIDSLIKKYLDDDYLVICDRYLDSSIAYQGYGRDLGLDYILKINEYALNYLPDLTIYLDVTPTVGLDRVSKRINKQDRLDNEKMEFYEKVQQGYLDIPKIFPKRKIVSVNVNNISLDIVIEKVIKIIEENCGIRIF